MNRPIVWLNGGLLVGVFLSALGVVFVKQQSRDLFYSSQVLVQEKDALDVEWGRLQLELGAWATHGRVEQVARDALHMAMPSTRRLLVIKKQQ